MPCWPGWVNVWRHILNRYLSRGLGSQGRELAPRFGYRIVRLVARWGDGSGSAVLRDSLSRSLSARLSLLSRDLPMVAASS